MIDVDCYASIAELLSTANHSRRPSTSGNEPFGNVHVIFFGDFKYPYPSDKSGSLLMLCFCFFGEDLMFCRPSVCV